MGRSYNRLVSSRTPLSTIGLIACFGLSACPALERAVRADAKVPSPRPTATLELATHCEPDQSVASAFEVALTVPLEWRPTFRLDDQVFGSSGMAALVTDMKASDGAGDLPLERAMVDDQGAQFLQLTGRRRAAGPVTLRYRARSVSANESGDRFGLRHDPSGIGGLGSFFLVLPDEPTIKRLRVQWTAGNCTQASARSFSSFGDGPQPIEVDGQLDALRGAVFYAGYPTVIDHDDRGGHLRSVWFGALAFDPAPAADWAAKANAAQREFFGDHDPRRYTLFVRVLPQQGERSNGMGQTNSLLLAIGPSVGFGPRLRTNMAHEMLHRWIGLRIHFAVPEGAGFWFTEGFDVYLTNRLLLEAGLSSPEEFLAEVNTAVTRLNANRHARADNETIRLGFFSDSELSFVPYARGALYAAELDAAIRASSKGGRSIDDVIRALDRQASLAPVDASGVRLIPLSDFRAALARELGAAGLERFDAVVIEGALPRPPADAYGPCFTRVPGASEWSRATGVPDSACHEHR